MLSPRDTKNPTEIFHKMHIYLVYRFMTLCNNKLRTLFRVKWIYTFPEIQQYHHVDKKTFTLESNALQINQIISHTQNTHNIRSIYFIRSKISKPLWVCVCVVCQQGKLFFCLIICTFYQYSQKTQNAHIPWESGVAHIQYTIYTRSETII